MDEKFIGDLIRECGKARILVASKYFDVEEIIRFHRWGLDYFGENRVDAFLSKYEALKDIPNLHLHFIGHLQSNKARLIADKMECLHSLDSLKLARIVNESRNSPLPCFIELRLTDNEAKSGVRLGDLPSFIEGLKPYPNIQVMGFMAMTDPDMKEEEKKALFHKTRELSTEYGYEETSMGMSGDYKIALAEGTSFVRLGSILR